MSFIEKLKIRGAKFYQPFMVCAVIFLIGLQINNEFQRRSAIEEIKAVTTINQQMISARGRLLNILLENQLQDNRLNAAQIDEIKTLWQKAELPESDSRQK